MANFFESGFTVLQELAKLKEKEKKQKLSEQAQHEKNKSRFLLRSKGLMKILIQNLNYF